LQANSNLTHFYTILRLNACEILITIFTFIFARIFKRVLESLALALSLSVLGLEATCPRQLGPWPWPRTFSESLVLASKVVSSLPSLLITQQNKEFGLNAY